MAYYSVGKFCPNVARGEFINLALATWDDGRCIIQVVEPTERAKVFDTHGYLAGVLEELHGLAQRIRTTADITQLPTSSMSILQFSTPSPVMAPSIEDAHELLWPLLVAPEEQE